MESTSDFHEERELPGARGVELVITSYGTSIRKRGERFLLQNNERQREIAARRVTTLVLGTGAYLSTAAVHLALEHNIHIVFLDGLGRPYGRVWRPTYGSTAAIRRAQLAAADSAEGFALVREWIDAKLDAQLAFLAELKRTRAKEAEWIGARIDRITAVRDRLGTLALEPSDELRGTLMGYEGTAGRMYFSVIARLLPERYAFHGRRARPARDAFNACLNYGYGMLYAHVEKACILAGLDPHVGILHADRYNKRSMVFDLIEPFRPYVDQPIFYLFSRRRVTEEHVEQDGDEVRLQDAGRKLVVEAVNTHLDAAIRYRGRNLKRENVILASAHQAANRLLDLFGDPEEELPPPEVDLPDTADLGDDDPDVFSDSLDEDTDVDLGPL